MIESLREYIPSFLHTRDGTRVAMHCIWSGSAKDRKTSVKSLKTHVAKVCMEEQGHLLLLSIFDSVDDTVLVQKVILDVSNRLALIAARLFISSLLALFNASQVIRSFFYLKKNSKPNFMAIKKKHFPYSFVFLSSLKTIQHKNKFVGFFRFIKSINILQVLMNI